MSMAIFALPLLLCLPLGVGSHVIELKDHLVPRPRQPMTILHDIMVDLGDLEKESNALIRSDSLVSSDPDYTEKYNARIDEAIEQAKGHGSGGRKAVMYGDEEAAVIEKIVTEIEAQEKFEKRARIIKICKAAFGVGVLIAGLLLPAAAPIIGLAALGVTVLVSAYEARLAAQMGASTSEAVGQFFFNVVKGTAVTALGLDFAELGFDVVAGSITGVAESVMDLLCSTMVDTVGGALDYDNTQKETQALTVMTKLTPANNALFNSNSKKFKDMTFPGGKTIADQTTFEQLKQAAGHSATNMQETPTDNVDQAVESFFGSAATEVGKYLSCGVWNPQQNKASTSSSLERERGIQPLINELQSKLPKGVKVVQHKTVEHSRPRLGTQHWHDEEDDEE